MCPCRLRLKSLGWTNPSATSRCLDWFKRHASPAKGRNPQSQVPFQSPFPDLTCCYRSIIAVPRPCRPPRCPREFDLLVASKDMVFTIYIQLCWKVSWPSTAPFARLHSSGSFPTETNSWGSAMLAVQLLVSFLNLVCAPSRLMK